MNSEFRVDKLYQSGVVAVLVVDRVEDAVPLARALVDGGVDVMELTLRTPAAIHALIEIVRNVPEITAGIGTILTTDQVEQVAASGAAFGVAPGLNARVVRAAQQQGLPFFPGIMTASEIEQAVELGCTIMKFFPSEPCGGLKYLNSVAAPYDHLNLRYVPLGGLNVGNLRSYLENERVLAIGGSWIATRKLIQAQDWERITQNAREACEIARQVRS
jgi:2-dehydro-3-deoxyphosphogluconate aldolase/(4S)-4-hydroxy-2-oxoglutarate aldolase